MEKNFLGYVGGVGAVGEDAVSQIEHTCVVISDEPIECRIGPRLKLGYQLGFIASPRQNLCQVGHALRRSSRPCPFN